MSDKDILSRVTDADEKMMYARALDKMTAAQRKNIPAYTAFFDPFKLPIGPPDPLRGDNRHIMTISSLILCQQIILIVEAIRNRSQ